MKRIRYRRSSRLTIGLLASLILGFGACAQTIVGPDQMNYCDTETYTTTITNSSATQSACLLEIVRDYTESGVDYVPGSTVITLHDETVLTDDPTGSTWNIDALLGSAYTLPPSESMTLSYDLETTCAAVSGTEQVTVNFVDCAAPATPLQDVSSASIEILPGAIVVRKTPSVQNASVGDLVTWTITVENTGLGRADNVMITDILGPGLAYTSSTGGGSNVGQITTWNGGSLEVGETVSVELTAELIACSGLYNDVDAAFGCGLEDTCFDTAADDGTATASLDLIVNNPSLSFTPPNVTVGYCTDETAGLIQITNSGSGTARNIVLCCDVAHLAVDSTRLPPGTTYSDSCFQVPDIAPGETFDLTFYVLHDSVDWCAGGPSGSNTFQLNYTNDCNIPFVAYPQFSNLTSEAGPTLNVNKTGPESLRLGEIGSYDITVEYVGSLDCGGISPGSVTIVDTYPDGFAVVDPAGGSVNVGARTITWTYSPTIDPPFAETIQLQAPTDCGYCAIPGGGTDDNSVTATGTDCCGCTISGSASTATTILCEGFGDGVDLFSSTMALNRTTVVRCSSSYDVEVTHTYVFADDPALDDLLLNEFTYFVDGNSDLLYEPGTAAVTGATLGTVADSTPAGRLELTLSDTSSVRGKTIVYSYHLSVLGLEDASCTASSYPINAGIELDPGASSINYCGTMYADPAQRLSVIAQPPAMSVSIDGIPTIQEYCATYDVTVTLTRTSDLAKPRDVRLVLTNTGGSILDMSQAVCGGDVSPTDGTTCTAPITGGMTYEWRFADAFVSGNTATITFPVTVPCGGPLANLSVVALFDDLCHDDAVYDDSCSTSSSDRASLSLSADVYARKSPEILYATTRDVKWSLVVHNTGNGTAYNVWLDDVLGNGLVFDAASTLPAGATVTANQDHEGNPINGATFLFDELAPGELKTITFSADLVSCTGLTNNIAASWGCDGVGCQAPRTDSSSVVVPTGNLVATSFSPTPVPMCSDNPATVTMKNAGVTTLYNIVANVTLPDGLVYLGNPEFSIDGGTLWNPAGEPAIAEQVLTWTSSEIATLEDMAPKDVVKIRFNYTVDCGFQGGNLSFQAAYENPCATPKLSNVGTFALGLASADVTVTLRQTSPASGEAIDCGGQATWEIDVENTGSSAVPVVEVEAILGDGLTYVDSAGDPTYGPADGGSNVLQSVFWEITDLPVDAIATLAVTATSAAGGFDCDALDIDVDASWGCGIVDGLSTTFDADCTTTFPSSGAISGNRQPPLNASASLSPGSIEGCDATTQLTLTIQNTGTIATTANIDVVVNLPIELTYVDGSSETDCGSGTFAPAPNPNGAGQIKTWYDIASEGGANDICESIAPGDSIRLRFDVDVSCYFTTQNIPITVYYYDCCGNEQYSDTTFVPLTSLTPTLVIDKSPANTTLDCFDAGDTATWTITVENTGPGTADWIRVTDTLGGSLVLDASDSPSAGAGIPMGTNIIGWEIGPLAPAETFTATVTAHLAQPTNNCAVSLRRDTATVLWGCGALDGDPNTTAEAACDIGSTIHDLANVRIPNLSISPSDIAPVVTCSGDGVAPSSGEIQLAVRNTGDGSVDADFEITLAETTTGYSVSDRFTALGGTLPLPAGTSQILTFSDWNVGCGSCNYTITAAVDFLDEICECREDDNLVSLPTTVTIPDLVAESAALSVACEGDGQIRIQGPISIRNDGCGEAATGTLRYRVTLYNGADCTGTAIDTFTQTWTDVSIPSGGGSEQRTLSIVRSLDLCTVSLLSVRIEVDDNDAFCECSGNNNGLCAGTYDLALPDLEILDVGATVPDACHPGVVVVTVRNAGAGAAPSGVAIEITGDATGSAVTPGLSPGASAEVTVPIDTSLTCGPKSITVTVDPDNTLCECRHGDNTFAHSFAVSDPDLAVTGLILSCQPDGTVRITASAANAGDEASGSVTLRVLLDGAPISTTVVSLEPGESLPIDLLSPPLSCGVTHGVRIDIDSSNELCECNEENNVVEGTVTCPCPALSVDKIVSRIERGGINIGTTGPVEPGDLVSYRYVIRNVGLGTAFRIDFSDTLPLGMVVETDAPGSAGTFSVTAPSSSGSLALVDGVSTFETAIAATIYGGESLTAEYTARVTSGITQGIDLVNTAVASGENADGSTIPSENAALGDTSDEDVEDPDADDTGITVLGTAVPALSVDKTITDVTRAGDSLGISGPVEPGDIVSYRFVIANVGEGTAYDVEFSDVLPSGLETLDAGTYAVSDPSRSGSLDLSSGLTTFTTAIQAEIAGGAYLTADFTAVVTSDVEQGVDLINTAEASGVDGFGTQIPDENPSVGDTLDEDTEDPDPDDTGIAIIGTEEPALSVDKVILDILRQGSSIGNAGPVEPGDIVFFEYTIRNIGLGTAYAVDFSDTLPTGMVVETSAPGDAGSYSVSGPAATGSLGLSDGVSTFTTNLAATIAGGESLTATYAVRVTSAITQDTDLINTAAAEGLDGAGTPIPGANPSLGDTSDEDAEDPDADDTGITILGAVVPALSVDKRVTDVIRNSVSLGVVDPLQYEDIVEYTVTIRNVGLGTAYSVDFSDTLPTGLETETDVPGNHGSYAVTAPASSGSLDLPDGASAFTTNLGVVLANGGSLVATYTVRVTPSAPPALDLVNTVVASGSDGAGTPIPVENAAAGDTQDDDAEDPDADDTGIASVRVGSPALVTRKSVAGINRQGTEVGGGLVEPGDIVTYELAVANVGSGPAQNVNVVDVLPSGFTYGGTPSAVWPAGSSSAPPSGVPGPVLMWTLNAGLEAGEELVVRFDARATSEIEQSSVYTNTVTATGEDDAGATIPPDHHNIVPEDTDPDDTSDVSLTGAVPALVTDKEIAGVRRDDVSLGPVSTIQSGDVLTYRLAVTNVGAGTAYDIDVRDMLPSSFSALSGTTSAIWPNSAGAYTWDPIGGEGPTLRWDTSATLGPGETLTLWFDAVVEGPTIAGSTYENVLQAEGIDGAETPIPANRSLDVPEDVDPDDRDKVVVTAIEEAPALVTSKRVTDVIRSGQSVSDRHVEEDDIVEYELTVENVGTVSAYAVNIRDQLPPEFGYIADTTSANWPLGSAFDDPSSSLGELQWSLDATLRPGDRIVLRFLCFVAGPIYDGTPYTNAMQAAGLGPDGSPVPEDQRAFIPADIDPDDASQTTLIGRSSFIQGEGGLIAVPILRKTAEIVSEAACDAWQATAPDLWFQTDIALYAAAEFERLGQWTGEATFQPGTLLPTWLRTVVSEAAAYARSNTLQVNAQSSIGLSLSHGPLILERAQEAGVTPEEALAVRLNELATRAGVSEDDESLPKGWIFLECAGGKPVYETWHDERLGISGRWTTLDQDITASALGMGLIEQVQEAESLLMADEPLDRYLGWVLVEVLSNKIVALAEDLTLRADVASPYIPHAVRWDARTQSFAVVDSDSHLFDQLSLIWGLSRAIDFIDRVSNAWPEQAALQGHRVRASAEAALHEVLQAATAYHLTDDGRQWTSVASPMAADDRPSASTLDLGLLLVALDASRGLVPAGDRAVVAQMTNSALASLLARRTPDGWFAKTDTANVEIPWDLLSQLSAIRGLLVVPRASTDVETLTVAQDAFDALSDLWIDGVGTGLYANQGSPEWQTTCYSPLEIGLAVGALRELALQSEGDRRTLIVTRLSGFVRSIVDEAALQLSNALPVGAAFTASGNAGSIAPLQLHEDETAPLSPVLQQQLCLQAPTDDTACGIWTRVEDDPWYRTDISMLAAYTLQDRMSDLEDIADANLNAVVLHSGFGISFDAFPSLASAMARYGMETGTETLASSLHPIALPFAEGSPATVQGDLRWDPSSFDERILASALGMTLLRECQEVRQELAQSALAPQEELLESLLLSSILEKLVVLQALQVEAPGPVSYVPHATGWSDPANRSGTVLDADSTTFDQLALLRGLSEAHELLGDARVLESLADQPFPNADWGGIVERLIINVLDTLEIAHLDPATGVLRDITHPIPGSGWERESTVDAATLGLMAAALDQVLDTFGPESSIGIRALRLLEIEVVFLKENLADLRGGFFESWPLVPNTDECDAVTLAGQLGPLRALLAAERWLGEDPGDVVWVFRTFDERFWDGSLSVYRAPSVTFQWCVTPLELALVVDTLTRMPALLPAGEAARLDTRLALHTDRILDAVPLQLSEEYEIQASTISTRAFAPVFDAHACLRASRTLAELGWAQPGELLRYTVSAENASDVSFYNLSLEDRVPESVQVVSTIPAGTIDDDGTLRWSFDTFEPGEQRTWQILTRISDTAVDGDTLPNCAVLTYTDSTGEREREACAEARVTSISINASEMLTSTPLSYATDEAMHLASSLDTLARTGLLNASTATLALALADANLGVLLAGSGLGPDPAAAGGIAISDESTSLLNATWGGSASASVEALRLGLVRPIVLPYETGRPMLSNSAGFEILAPDITPASLGWTLTREAQYIAAHVKDEVPILQELAAWTHIVLDAQLTWIQTLLRDGASQTRYLPQAISSSIANEAVTFGVRDPRSSLYDQASLLIGLATVAGTDSLGTPTRQSAGQLAQAIYEHLLVHWDGVVGRFIDTLEGDQTVRTADWEDQAVAATALRLMIVLRPQEQSRISSILRSLATHALRMTDASSAMDDIGRGLVLAIAAGVVDDLRFQEGAIETWQQLLDQAMPAGENAFSLSPRTRRDWGNAPGQLGLLCDFMAHLVEIPGGTASVLRAGESLIRINVEEDRVQIASPSGYWSIHAQLPCEGSAPVFARREDSLPRWFDILR